MSKIFKLFSKNKKTLLIIMGVGLILFLVPLQSVKASPDVPWSSCAWFDVGCILWKAFEYIITFPLRIVVFVVVLFLSLIALGAGVLFSLITALLAWMMEIFIRVPIIYNMPMVQAGWTFCRDFANMFFILLLVFIGLSTILKIRDYEAKKTLPRLIIIALLVNFSPVIVGFIVDISNIVTNFFIRNVGNLAGLADLLTGPRGITNYIITAGEQILTGPTDQFLVNAPGFIIYGIVLIVFFLYASWIYLLFTLIFLLRVVYLWMLTILAPIAFLSYVLPPTKWAKKIFPSILHWDEWWEKLIQWAIVGIPMGFFLYLANYFLGLDVGTIFSISKLGGLEPSFIDLVTNTLGPTVALLLLHQGYKISKAAMPEAAKGIIEGVKKVGTFATAVGITGVTAGVGAGAAADVLGKTTAGAQRLEAFMGKVPIIGKPLKYGVGKPISWATRAMEIVAAPPLLEYKAKTERIKIPEGFEEMSPTQQAQLTKVQLTGGGKVLLTSKMAELETLGKVPGKAGEEFRERMIVEAEKLAKRPRYRKEVGKIIDALPDKITQKMVIDFEMDDDAKEKMRERIDKLAVEISADVTLRPQIKERVKERKITKEQAARDFAAGAIHLGGMKSKDISKIATKEFWNAPGAMKELQKSWGGPRLRSGAEKGGRKFIEDYMKEADRREARAPGWFIENNPRASLYLSGNAAQDFGFRSPEGLTREQVRDLINWYRATYP